MDERERNELLRLSKLLEAVLCGTTTTGSAGTSDIPECIPLEEAITRLGTLLAEARSFIADLSQGMLDIEPPPKNPLIAPFKQMHANLRHLTWQTKQIAAGDLDQQVDFLGSFSVAFNSMIAALREKRTAEEKIRYLSMHDPLTDLYNRGYFDEEMKRLENGRGFPISIMMADLDGLKKVNDNLGHAVGDSLIRDAAQILRRAVRSSDVVARTGGDEFALILPRTDAPSALRIIERIRRVEAEFNSNSSQYQVSFSIGVATSGSGDPLSGTLKSADEMMYKDKFSRKNRFVR